VSLLIGLALAIGQSSDATSERCVDPKSEKDIAICQYLKAWEELEIRSVDSVAVGTREQLLPVREQARNCGLMNRIDYVGTKVAVFDIINADGEGRECLGLWLQEHAPDLIFSEDRLDALMRLHRQAETEIAR